MDYVQCRNEKFTSNCPYARKSQSPVVLQYAVLFKFFVQAEFKGPLKKEVIS